MRKPTSCSIVPGSLLPGSCSLRNTPSFSLSFSSLPPLSSLFSSFLFFSFPPFLLFLSFLSLLLSSLSLFFPSSSFSLLPYELNWSSPFIAFKGAMHVETWHAMRHPHGSPCVLYMARHVSPNTRCLEIREILTISEFNEIRLG